MSRFLLGFAIGAAIGTAAVAVGVARGGGAGAIRARLSGALAAGREAMTVYERDTWGQYRARAAGELRDAQRGLSDGFAA